MFSRSNFTFGPQFNIQTGTLLTQSFVLPSSLIPVNVFHLATEADDPLITENDNSLVTE